MNYHHNEKKTYSETSRNIGSVEFSVLHLSEAAAGKYKVPFPNGEV